MHARPRYLENQVQDTGYMVLGNVTQTRMVVRPEPPAFAGRLMVCQDVLS
jgi:hypothetical protein